MLMVWCFIANHSFLHAGVILPRFSPPVKRELNRDRCQGPAARGTDGWSSTARFLLVFDDLVVFSRLIFSGKILFLAYWNLILTLLMIFSQNWNGWEIHFRAFSPWLPTRKAGRAATDSAFMRLFILPMIGSAAFAISPTNQKLPFRGKKQFQQDFRLGHTHRYSSFHLVLLQFL